MPSDSSNKQSQEHKNNSSISMSSSSSELEDSLTFGQLKSPQQSADSLEPKDPETPKNCQDEEQKLFIIDEKSDS